MSRTMDRLASTATAGVREHGQRHTDGRGGGTCRRKLTSSNGAVASRGVGID
jgi:hypothetical protein